MKMTEMSEVPPDGTLERFLHSVMVCEEFGVDEFSSLLSEASAAAQEIYNMSVSVMTFAATLCNKSKEPQEGESDFELWMRIIQDHVAKVEGQAQDGSAVAMALSGFLCGGPCGPRLDGESNPELYIRMIKEYVAWSIEKDRKDRKDG